MQRGHVLHHHHHHRGGRLPPSLSLSIRYADMAKSLIWDMWVMWNTISSGYRIHKKCTVFYGEDLLFFAFGYGQDWSPLHLWLPSKPSRNLLVKFFENIFHGIGLHLKSWNIIKLLFLNILFEIIFTRVEDVFKKIHLN